MDGITNRTGSSGEHIWLRYATQFSQDGRTYTVEMGIPVPLGASAEERAQLIQEAQVGMDQLASHVEKRVAQSLKHGSQSTAPVGATASPPPPLPRPAPAAVPAPVRRPASVSAPPTAPPSTAGASGQNAARDVVQEQVSEPLVLPPTRPSLSASMPLALGSNDLKLPQFIQQIRDELNLKPQEAMKILKVKSLSPETGINLRDALEQLRRTVVSGSNDAASAEHRDEAGDTRDTGALEGVGGEELPDASTHYPQRRAQRDGFDAEDVRNDIAAANTIPMPPMRPPAPTPLQLHSVPRGFGDEEERESAKVVRDGQPTYMIFDEEEEEPGEEDDLKEDELLEDLDEPSVLSTQERVHGRTQINRLRESRGATTANANRQSVLRKITSTQISEDQLQGLVEGVWSVTDLKRLKVDQVEALIAWAKEDDFVSDVETVLVLLEEEHYARGNR